MWRYAPVSWKSQVLDEAAETVARNELLALELEARRGRGIVFFEPLLDGAALVRMAVNLLGAPGRDDECARVRDDVPYTKEGGGVCAGQAAGAQGCLGQGTIGAPC